MSLLGAPTLFAQMVAAIRADLAAGRLTPGARLGSEAELATRFGVSRIVARDALRTLAALGVVDIRVGAGGGARIAASSPELFAEALGVQLDLLGVTAGEVMDVQRALECLGAELAAEHATEADHANLAGLLADAEAALDRPDVFTDLGRRFHLEIARASGNRVLAMQLASMQRIAWPHRNRTYTRELGRHVLDVHAELARLLRLRDTAAARGCMDDHVRMIAARRRAEHACC